MTTTVSVEAIRRSLAQAPGVVEALIASAPPEALTWRDAQDSWSAVEVLAHVADGEITDWMPRIELIVSGGGTFVPFDRVGGFARYRGWSAVALVGEFAQLRRTNLKKLSAMGILPAHLKMTARHPELGTVTLAELLSCWATHDLAHIAQISRLFTRWFGRDVGPWTKYFSLLQGRS